MSRLGITYEEVEEAALSIEKKGETPTIDKVRAHLGGTGSNTTISKYLQHWRQQLFSSPSTKTPSTPDLVKAAVDRVWDEMREQTNSEIESIKMETQQLIDAAEKRAHVAETNANVLKSELTQLQQTYVAQSAEKELLLLDIKKLREEQALLQERFNGLEVRYADLQVSSTQHLKNLSNTHQQETLQLKEAHRHHMEDQTKLIDTLKNHYEKERQDHSVIVDNLKVENKKLNEVLQRLDLQSQEKFATIKKLEADLKIMTADRDQRIHQLAEYQQKWSYFNNKTIVSNDILNKIYDTPKLDDLLNQTIAYMNNSLDKKFLELKDTINFNEIARLLKEKTKAEQDE